MALTRLGANQLINLASNVTGTLPASNGGTGATSFLPGKVLQVVTGETTTNTQITSTSYTDTTLTANITPSATSSKILVLVSQNVQMERSTYETNTFLQLLRDSTTISIKTVGLSTGAGNSQGCRHTFAISHLDEPSTTSAITYKTQGKTNDSNTTSRFQEGGSRSEIVLIEIEG
tara:strand:+ start:27 stop:551 length:525 start_codon:yes stop_codon:yes gene_type:complete